MSNLTFDDKLIREHAAAPLEGHTVVVLERVGETGEKFHSLLEPGDDVPRKSLIDYLRRKPTVYFAFAVDAGRHRQLSFSAPVQMAEHAHDFELSFSLWYRVADPQLLVSHRASDPLELIRRKVVETVTEEIAELPWADVWHAFRSVADGVVDATMPRLKSFARDHGVSISSLRLRARFPDDAVAVDRGIRKAQEEKRLNIAVFDADQELRTHKLRRQRASDALEYEQMTVSAQRRHLDAIARATTEKTARLIGESSSVAEMREVHAALGAPSWNGAGANGHAARGNGALTAGGASAALPPAGEAGLPGVLADLVTHTQFRPDAQSRRVRSALLHLVAAVVADDSLQLSPEVAEHARRVAAEIGAAAHLPASQAEALHALADPERLRPRLYP